MSTRTISSHGRPNRSGTREGGVTLYFLYVEETGEVFYVGITAYFDERLKQHIYASKHYDYHISRKIRKLLKNEQTFGIQKLLEFNTRVAASENEKKYIRWCKSVGMKLCNSTSGGDNEFAHTPQTKEKIRQKLLKHWKDPKARERARENGKKIRRMHPFKGETHPMYGVKRPEVGKKNKETKSKPVLQLELSGTVIREHRGVREAARFIGVCHSGIGACCKGRQKTSAGFIWKYKED